jgi:hypothetical protein
LQRVIVQAQVGYQLLARTVLFFDLTQPEQLYDAHPGELPLPAIESLL